jgi:hypothetical protein
MPSLHKTRELIARSRLTLAELEQLDSWLHELIAERSAPPAPAPRRDREVVQRTARGRVTLQLEYVRCGKAGCRCAQGDKGDLHGPYWYSYQTVAGKTRSHYLGKDLPSAMASDDDSSSTRSIPIQLVPRSEPSNVDAPAHLAAWQVVSKPRSIEIRKR